MNDDKTILNLQQLSKSFLLKGQNLPVLDRISFAMHPGDFISIVGRSGCGKSTLLRMIAGLDLDFQGRILFAGEDIKGPSLKRGVIFQDHRLFPWLTVEKNIELALQNARISRAEKKEIVRRHIELVGLQGFGTAFPQQLSGGMAQRVAIARSLVNRPNLLLLDEPFGALDALTRAKLQRELLQIWRQEAMTMIMVTHDVDEALLLGTRVLVMEPNPGRIHKDFPVPPAIKDPANAAAFHEIKQDILASLAPLDGARARVDIPALSPSFQTRFA